MQLFNCLLLAAALGLAAAVCPSGCSGHGTCNMYDECTCFTEGKSTYFGYLYDTAKGYNRVKEDAIRQAKADATTFGYSAQITSEQNSRYLSKSAYVQKQYTGPDCADMTCPRGVSWTNNFSQNYEFNSPTQPEVQILTTNANAGVTIGGTFTLNSGGGASGNIAALATAEVLRAALQAVTADGIVRVTGGTQYVTSAGFNGCTVDGNQSPPQGAAAVCGNVAVATSRQWFITFLPTAAAPSRNRAALIVAVGSLTGAGKEGSVTTVQEGCCGSNNVVAPSHNSCRHADFVECSDAGVCDRSSGTCECFEGYEGGACQRTSCLNECSGHGQCQSNIEFSRDGSLARATTGGTAAAGYATNADDTSQVDPRKDYIGAWDSGIHFGCKCDVGFRGTDCSLVECPSTTDPLGWYGNDDGEDCSGRGLCDYGSGECTCFAGYTGVDCGTVEALA